MDIRKKVFGRMPDGTEVFCFTMQSETGCRAELINYGAAIRSIVVPDKNGQPVDVVLGYDTLDQYRNNTGFFGATVGRFANRIARARFTLNGREYRLAENNGKNHLHGGIRGFDKCVWNWKIQDDQLIFSRLSPDGEEGYPGNLQVEVSVSLRENRLMLHYRARSDQDTVLNLTNHSYFNLNGCGNIENHLLQIYADRFTAVNEAIIPTGEILPVSGTPMDFRNPKPIGRDADLEEPCVRQTGGYDTNFILTGQQPAATAFAPESGILMTVTTDQPGLQLYSGNGMAAREGKKGCHYQRRSGFCLETQHFPDSVHHPDWPSCTVKAGSCFESTTSFEFSVPHSSIFSV